MRGLPLSETDDVYSLGVLLYILLTGRHPYRFGSREPEEILRSILEGRVQRPSELQRDLKRDLDKVVLKALRRKPERRYVSVDEMAEDIRRYLAGRPVSARSDLRSARTVSKAIGPCSTEESSIAVRGLGAVTMQSCSRGWVTRIAL